MNRHLCLAALLLAACHRSEPAPTEQPAPVVSSAPVATADAMPLATPVARPPMEICPTPARCDALAVPAGAEISLRRTECYGSCPVYTVTVRADGTVTWNGEENVLIKGTATATVDPAQVRVLFDYATTTCLFAMKKEYRVPITDSSSAIVKVKLGAKSKETLVYPASKDTWELIGGGSSFCRPPDALFDLFDRIDKVAGTTRWIGRR